MSNYIISTKHTRLNDRFITFWRPNNSGYTMAVPSAGEYPNPENGYHISDDAFPVSIRSINSLTIIGDFDGSKCRVLPNTKEVWLALNQPDIAKKFK